MGADTRGTIEQDFVEYFTRPVKKETEGLCRERIGLHDAAAEQRFSRESLS